jgi:hypothetical protein
MYAHAGSANQFLHVQELATSTDKKEEKESPSSK